MSKTPLIISVAVLGISVLSACASAPARSADRPALVIPLPPAHVVEPTPEPPPEPVADVPSPPVAAPAARPVRGTRDVSSKPPSAEIKPDAKPDEPPAAPAPIAPPVPAPQLRTADAGGAEKAVRATVDRARQLLAGVDYRGLNKELKKAYDDAKQFAQQADDALKAGNTVFAQGVASKAETLAKELAAR